MSMSYWFIEGVGIDISKIEEHLNKEKVIRFLLKDLSHEEDIVAELTDILSRGAPYDNFDIDDYLYGEPYNGIEEILYNCDDTSTLTYGDNGDGGHYIYYARSYPWEHRDNEPNTIGDVHKILIDAVKKLTNLNSLEIEDMIDDDIYEYGCG